MLLLNGLSGAKLALLERCLSADLYFLKVQVLRKLDSSAPQLQLHKPLRVPF